MNDPGDTKRLEVHREEIAAVKHFLELNNLTLLKFSIPEDVYKRSRSLYNESFPLYIRNYDQSSTVVYVDVHYYSTKEQTLTVRVEELLKYL